MSQPWRNHVKLFCMVFTISGLSFFYFSNPLQKKLTFSASAKFPSLSTLLLLENSFSSQALGQPQQDRAGAEAEMGISQQRDLISLPVSIFLTGARESSQWDTGPTGSRGGMVPFSMAKRDSDQKDRERQKKNIMTAYLLKHWKTPKRTFKQASNNQLCFLSNKTSYKNFLFSQSCISVTPGSQEGYRFEEKKVRDGRGEERR